MWGTQPFAITTRNRAALFLWQGLRFLLTKSRPAKKTSPTTNDALLPDAIASGMAPLIVIKGDCGRELLAFLNFLR
jgi:hypothetical protein